MKLVNSLCTLFVVLFIAQAAPAQDYKLTVENSRAGKLTLSNFSNEMPIEGYSGNEIIITSDSKTQGTPERAKGLKAVYAAGTDNTGLGLYVEKKGNEITIQCLLPVTKRSNYKIKVPDNLALNITSGCERGNSLVISNMKNEIEINNCHSVDLKNVSGPLVVSTISGTVDVVLTGINKDKPTSIASVSGEVDVTLPATVAANLEMSTISGNMYADFDLDTQNNSMKRVGGHAIKTKLNGGGGDLKISSISGNIYLRKAK